MRGKRSINLLLVFLFAFLVCSDNIRISSAQASSVQPELSSEKYKDKILFIGDSITYGCDWNQLLGRKDIVNLGIGGDTTSGVLNRLDAYLNQKPKSIFIMIGINDILRNTDIDTVKTNYSKIINKILSNNVQLFIQSTLNNNILPEKNKNVAILNNYLIEQCKLLSIQYIDINKKLSENNVLSAKYSYDGLHLNGIGYIIWKQIVLPYVDVKLDSK